MYKCHHTGIVIPIIKIKDKTSSYFCNRNRIKVTIALQLNAIRYSIYENKAYAIGEIQVSNIIVEDLFMPYFGSDLKC